MSAVMWSRRCLRSMIRAAEFSTLCNDRRWTALTQYNTLLQ